eukprot:758349-Hanusia_phi.AAC.1
MMYDTQRLASTIADTCGSTQSRGGRGGERKDERSRKDGRERERWREREREEEEEEGGGSSEVPRAARPGVSSRRARNTCQTSAGDELGTSWDPPDRLVVLVVSLHKRNR